MYKTILIALDGSDFSEQVIASLENLKMNPESKIILSHVIPSAPADEEADRPQPSWESLYPQIESQLLNYQNQIPNSEIEIVNGDIAEEIIRLANIYQVDLIIMGTRGLTGLQRVIKGSVSSQVIAEAPCAVLVVKLTE